MPAPIIDVYTALFPYTAASDQELTIAEGDLLYLLEKADDGWWTVKKRVEGNASEEKSGIVPHNFIGSAPKIGKAHALYPYQPQSDEELAFSEGTVFDIYARDGDWVLCGTSNGKFGFVPANYIEMVSGDPPPAISKMAPPKHPALAAAAVTRASPVSVERTDRDRAPPSEDNEDAPPMPPRPGNERPSIERHGSARPAPRDSDTPVQGKSQFRSWNVQEIDGRRKSRSTLAINASTLMITPERGPQQQWAIGDVITYSSEKKHVFLEMENPRASLDFRVSSQDIGDQILSSIGQVAGANRAGGLTEVMVAAKSAGEREGKVTLDFQAVDGREVSVREGENVFVLEQKDPKWWLVRTSTGKEGLVPASFVTVEDSPGKLSAIAGAFGLKKKQKDDRGASSRSRSKSDVGRDRDPGDRDERSRHVSDHDRRPTRATSTRRDKHDSVSSRPKPDPRKVRVWTDRSGTFRVEAALLGCADGKVHLHKVNGVKIAVPANKLSTPDLEYVEGVTGVSLADDKPLVEQGGSRSSKDKGSSRRERADKSSSRSRPTEDEFDWFQFFLDAGVDVHNCQRYTINFTRDRMDESIIPNITPQILRNLGLREGDILRVTKMISEKYGGTSGPSGESGLFTGSDGLLKNNTSKTQLAQQSTGQKHANEQVWTPRNEPEGEAPTMPARPAAETQPPQAVPYSQMSSTPQVSSQPTGALADLLGFAPLQPQKTAESKLAEQQQAQQRQLLQQQGDLQRQQLELLKQQQNHLKNQQNEFLKLQRTGPQPLGPFATGVAQQSTGVFATPVSQSGSLVPTRSTENLFQQRTGPFSTLPSQSTGPLPQQTGPFAPLQTSATGHSQQLTGPLSQQSGPFTPQSGSFSAQRTGPFSQPTGPFTQQPTGPFSQQQPTGPFSQQQPTGPFSQQQPTGPFSQQPTGPFSQQPTGPFSQQPTGPFSQQPTGPFSQQPTGPFSQQPAGPFTQQPTGPFSQQPTGPFSQQTTGQFSQLRPSTQQDPFNTQTGPFGSQQSGPFSSQPGPFSTQLPTATSSRGLGTFVGQQSGQFPTGPAGTFQPSLTGLSQNAQPMNKQNTGPFGQSSSNSMQFGIQGTPFSQQAAGGAGQQSAGLGQMPMGLQRTGPFSSSQPSSYGQANSLSTGFSQPPQSSFAPSSFVPNSQVPSNMMGQQQLMQNSFSGAPFSTNIMGTTPVGSGMGQPARAQQPFNTFSQHLGQALPSSTPLQQQPTGFGFGNQPALQQQGTGNRRADISTASANNPFGFGR